MSATPLTVGAMVMLAKDDLQAVIDALRQRGYRTIGPQVADAAIVYDDIHDVRQLPIGMLDLQDGGKYRLQTSATAGWFDYVVGPHSLKNYLFPPRETLLSIDIVDGQWQTSPPAPVAEPIAVIGVRACDLAALEVQDRVFLHGPYVDPAYQARRANLFTVANNCRRAAATCFCHSMQTGPAVRSGFDLALTELDEAFVVQIGSDRGADLLADVPCTACSPDDAAEAQRVSEQLAHDMAQRGTASCETTAGEPRERSLDTRDIRDLLLGNLEHPHWDRIAERCLSCANCTLVCPTCFCSSVSEISDLSGEHVQRERTWASCFTAEHSSMNSGVVRKSTSSRYRQWLTHKLASWIDQFDVSGCVGCGRCITWCPVGIDLTEEVAAIRQEDAR
jgi:ferredoxin